MRITIPHPSSFIPHRCWYLLWFLCCVCLPAFAQENGGDGPSPVPFPGDGLFNDQPPFLAGVTVDHADFAYREGDRLRVQFMAEREAFLYLLYHQADGQSRLLFPNVAQPENRMPAKQPVVVPGAEQSLRFRIGPPFGTEVLQVLATVQPVPELDTLIVAPPTGDVPTAPVLDRQFFEQLQARLLKDKTVWTEHRVVLRTEAKAPPSPPRKAARVGLFIGIGKYLHPEYAHTHEELANSAKMMYEVMLKLGGLDPARTKLVLNEQATKANVQQLIMRWLPSVSRPGDTVFIYFSGHAGQFDTLDPSERDGRDETLAPYDTSYGTDSMPFAARLRRHRETVILDDTLARWLLALSGRQVVFICDTCHSGGLVEGKDVSVGNGAPSGPRGVPPNEGGATRRQASGVGRQDISVGNALRGVPNAAGTAALPLPPGEARGDGGNNLPLPPGEGRGEGASPALDLSILTDEALRLKDISQLNTIVITSCASDEQSLFEGIKNKTMWFTYCLTEAMTNPKAPHPLSVQDAFGYSRKRMKQLLAEGNARREQEPTMTDTILLPVVLSP